MVISSFGFVVLLLFDISPGEVIKWPDQFDRPGSLFLLGKIDAFLEIPHSISALLCIAGQVASRAVEIGEDPRLHSGFRMVSGYALIDERYSSRPILFREVRSDLIEHCEIIDRGESFFLH